MSADKPQEPITRRELFCVARREITAAAQDAASLAGLATGKVLNTVLGPPKKPDNKK